MPRTSTLLLAMTLAFVGGVTAAPVTPFVVDRNSRAVDGTVQSDASRLILVQNRTRGGGAQRPAARANRSGGFNSNDFHQNVSNTRNVNAATNRNVTVNSNRNVNVSGGGCCYGNYSTGPNWGGIAAGVAVGAMVGAAASAAASSPTYVAPPPTYPPEYVTPPPY